MYDHEYEWQILGFLRILKYIWQRNKSILADLVRDYRCGEIDTEDIFELSVMLLVEYICVDYLPEDDPNDFYGEEYTCYLLMESELDDFLTLNMESVDDLANVRPTGQVIMAKCVSKAELSVRPVKPILTAMSTAA